MGGPLTLAGEDAGDDPLALFRRWLAAAAEALTLGGEAMVLATATPDGRPSARAVLLRGLDERGLVFFTDTRSRKGGELATNPRAAAVFVWPPLERQVRVEGPVAAVDDPEADAYFATRPRGHRLAAWSSTQSQEVSGREELERRMAEAAGRYRDAEVPRPSYWGGYRLAPEAWEFWAGRESRVHDRVLFRRLPGHGGWERARLSP
ncbi:MAG: pyridoxamine 5'-phosphate oxidase [Acidimicrobiales bacterium]